MSLFTTLCEETDPDADVTSTAAHLEALDDPRRARADQVPRRRADPFAPRPSPFERLGAIFVDRVAKRIDEPFKPRVVSEQGDESWDILPLVVRRPVPFPEVSEMGVGGMTSDLRRHLGAPEIAEFAPVQARRIVPDCGPHTSGSCGGGSVHWGRIVPKPPHATMYGPCPAQATRIVPVGPQTVGRSTVK
ncbi:MAG TPA: hypothetical protein VF545_05980 [Thermoleophilaceae bacterium]